MNTTNTAAVALSPATVRALRDLADGRDHERTACHYSLVRHGLAVVTERHEVLDERVTGTAVLAKVRITAAGRARLA